MTLALAAFVVGAVVGWLAAGAYAFATLGRLFERYPRLARELESARALEEVRLEELRRAREWRK